MDRAHLHRCGLRVLERQGDASASQMIFGLLSSARLATYGAAVFFFLSLAESEGLDIQVGLWEGLHGKAMSSRTGLVIVENTQLSMEGKGWRINGAAVPG
ncbi:hypothetical protein GMOD_00004140 [Pyrenophora seminiperda CCB06]|uniref:Uncharacterized protein n=1 Tax=Pyrenophora seminiperda CCB06 TaxID=1302712 RepID=A0A3M7M0U4_9PLEO|nr:hypothetical protein GMOD_00004140 [Pyrenophora seminiperda CCB06]